MALSYSPTSGLEDSARMRHISDYRVDFALGRISLCISLKDMPNSVVRERGGMKDYVVTT